MFAWSVCAGDQPNAGGLFPLGLLEPECRPHREDSAASARTTERSAPAFSVFPGFGIGRSCGGQLLFGANDSVIMATASGTCITSPPEPRILYPALSA
jgi:hypothetical protein